MRYWKTLFPLGLAIFVLGGNPPSASQNAPPAQEQNTAADQGILTNRDLEHVEHRLTNALAAQKNDFDRRLLSLELWKIILGSLLGLNLLGLFYAMKKLGEKHLDAVEKRLAYTTDRKLSLIHEHLNALDHEREVKQKWRILILANPDDSSALDLLEGMGFDGLSLKPYPGQPVLDAQRFAELGEERFDLVLFDQLDEARINHYMGRSQKPVFVSYSPKPMRVNVAAQHKINFANSPMTLFNRIIEAARYQHALQYRQSKKSRA